MNNNFFWIAWLFIVLVQTFFLFNHWLKSKEQQKKWDKNFEIETDGSQWLDTMMFLVYNSKAYWKKDGSMYRGSYKDGKVYMKTIEKIDPFELKDISPAELMIILDRLEGASI
jgi:hypothetical protein